MLTLTGAFAYPLMRQAAHKRIFGKPKIDYWNVLAIGGFVYESSALVGRALAGKALVLEKLLGHPQHEGDLITFLKDQARKRKQSFPNEDSLGMLIIKSEMMSRLGLSLDMSNPKVLAALRHELPADEMLPKIEILCAEGIGFGLAFPEDTERMYRSTYEAVNEDIWAMFHRSGLAIPKHFTPYPLAQREKDYLSLVAEYVHEFRPELEDALGLTSHLS